MTRRARTLSLALAVLLVSAAFTAYADAPSAPGIGGNSNNKSAGKNAPKSEDTKSGDDKPFDQVVKDMTPIKGLFTLYRRAEDNKLYLEIMPDQLDHVCLFPQTKNRSP